MARIDAALEQWSNGPAPDRAAGDGWVNTRLGAGGAHHLEGDTVPYRLVIEGATVGTTYAVTLEWDTTVQGRHALDYLGTWDASFPFGRAETVPDPLTGVAGVAPGTLRFEPVPRDARVAAGADRKAGTADDITQGPGSFIVLGGVAGLRFVDLGNDGALGGSGGNADRVPASSPYAFSGSYRSNSSTALTLAFTYTGGSDAAPGDTGTVVLAWGARVATRDDWGATGSAGDLGATPFRMRLVNVTDDDAATTDSGASDDLSLTAGAVVYPAEVVVQALAGTGASAQPFGFEWPRAADSTDVIAGRLDLSGDGRVDADDDGRFTDSGGEVFDVSDGLLSDRAGGDGTVNGLFIVDGALDTSGGGFVDFSDTVANLPGLGVATFTLEAGASRRFDRLTDFRVQDVRETGAAAGFELARVEILRTDIGGGSATSVVADPVGGQVAIGLTEGVTFHLTFQHEAVAAAALVGVPAADGLQP